MTDELREVLTRVAGRAGPASVDPLLWSRASRARRRREGLTVAATVLVVVALLGGIAVAAGVLPADPPPVDRPDPPKLIDIEGIAGDGGLRLEKDRAIGRASVAIANDTGAFVVTADDGVPHRIALPGFDAPLYARTAAKHGVDLPEVLSLSPDGTKLIYAWHEPFVPQVGDGRGEPGEGWVESGARLLDLTTGAIDTYPSGPDGPGVTTQMGRFTWNFRWSTDSRLVAFDEKITTDLGWGGWEGMPGLVLDTTQQMTWDRQDGTQTNPRGVPEMRGPETAAPAVNEAGQAAWVHTPDLRGRPQYREQTLMTGTDGASRPRPLPDDAIWGGARFFPDGQTLLVEPASPSDRMLVIDPGHADSARQLRLEGDLPSEQLRTQLLGWVGPDKMLAAVHKATGSRTWQADADLALLTLNLDAGTADLAVVGHVDAGDTGSAFSYATDLLAVGIPAEESAKSVVNEPGPARDPDGASTLDPTELSDHPWLTLGAVGLAFGALLLVMTLRRKRT